MYLTQKGFLLFLSIFLTVVIIMFLLLFFLVVVEWLFCLYMGDIHFNDLMHMSCTYVFVIRCAI